MQKNTEQLFNTEDLNESFNLNKTIYNLKDSQCDLNETFIESSDDDSRDENEVRLIYTRIESEEEDEEEYHENEDEAITQIGTLNPLLWREQFTQRAEKQLQKSQSKPLVHKKPKRATAQQKRLIKILNDSQSYSKKPDTSLLPPSTITTEVRLSQSPEPPPFLLQQPDQKPVLRTVNEIRVSQQSKSSNDDDPGLNEPIRNLSQKLNSSFTVFEAMPSHRRSQLNIEVSVDLEEIFDEDTERLEQNFLNMPIQYTQLSSPMAPKKCKARTLLEAPAVTKTSKTSNEVDFQWELPATSTKIGFGSAFTTSFGSPATPVNKGSVGFGFSSASGSKFRISESAMKKAAKAFAMNNDDESGNDENDYSDEDIEAMERKFLESSLPTQPTQRKSPKKMEHLEKKTFLVKADRIESLTTVKETFTRLQMPSPSTSFTSPALRSFGTPATPVGFNSPAGFGFSSASGSKFKVSELALKKAAKDFATVNEDHDDLNTECMERNFLESALETQATQRTSPKIMNKFSLVKPDMIDSPKTSKKPLPRPQMPVSTALMSPAGFSFASASGSKFKLSEQAMKRAAKQFELNNADDEMDDIITPIKHRAKKLKLDQFDSPAASSPVVIESFTKGIKQHSTPFVTRPQCSPENLSALEIAEVESINQIVALMDDEDSEACPSSPKKRRLNRVRLINKLNDPDDVPDDVKSERRDCLEEQRISIKDKEDCDKAPMTGSLFMKKSSKNKIKLKDYVEASRPLRLYRHDITLDNAIDYKFKLRNFMLNKLDANIIEVPEVGDNARLIVNEASEVGFEEIKLSFFSSPAVDPKLASEAWVENSFKLILLKLAWLENRFFKFEEFELLNPNNVLLQMKYRYDREIDRTQRSAIRKIVELDEIPARRMVLKVVGGYNRPKIGYELELSDGWYTIRTAIDRGLVDAIDCDKIRIGTKLIVSSAQIFGCEGGFDPLNKPDTVRLKIHANSTRRTAWHQKLGFCKNSHPFPVSLDSVIAAGGVIGKLIVTITHVYDIIYVDSSGVQKEFRSERIQMRLQNRLNMSHYENVNYKVLDEMHAELLERCKSIKFKGSNYDELTAHEICDLIERETDGEDAAEIQNAISSKMLRKIQLVRYERNQEMSTRILEKLGETDRQVSQLLKFRVVDAKNPNKTALISCWSVTEDLLDIVREGSVIEIVNSNATQFGKELSITIGKSAWIGPSKVKIAEETVKKYSRNETRISEIGRGFHPAHEEFDLACLVLSAIPSSSTSKFEKVYAVDENFNVVCLNFWSSVKEFAYDDVVARGQIVYARNLQWRASQSNEKIPQAFVSKDSSSFSLHPKNKNHQNRLTEMRRNVGDVKEFLQKCDEKFPEFQSPSDKENEDFVADQSSSSDLSSGFVENNERSSRSSSPNIASTAKRSLGMRIPSGKQSAKISRPSSKPSKLNALQQLAFK